LPPPISDEGIDDADPQTGRPSRPVVGSLPPRGPASRAGQPRDVKKSRVRNRAGSEMLEIDPGTQNTRLAGVTRLCYIGRARITPTEMAGYRAPRRLRRPDRAQADSVSAVTYSWLANVRHPQSSRALEVHVPRTSNRKTGYARRNPTEWQWKVEHGEVRRGKLV